MCPDAPAKQHRGTSIRRGGHKSAHEERQQGAHPSPRRGAAPERPVLFQVQRCERQDEVQVLMDAYHARPPSQGQKVGAVPPRNREAGATRSV